MKLHYKAQKEDGTFYEDEREAADKFGSQCIVVAIDAKRKESEKPKWEVYIYSGQKATGIDALTWALWGRARARNSDDELIHLGQTEMAVEFEYQRDW